VDPPGAKIDDRIFVIASHKKAGEDILSINGKSWPYTEHFAFSLGETVHWRIN